MFTGTLQPGYFGPTHEFAVERDGTATATLTWTEPKAELNVQLTASQCGVLCKVLTSSEGQAGRVRKVTRVVREGERYAADVINETALIGTSYTLEVVVQ
jgi:hypothetical protein